MGPKYDDDRPRVTLTRRAGLVTLLVVLLAGMALRSCVDSGPGTSHGDAGRGRPASVGPHATSAGMPVGYARSRAGVLAAATTLVRQGQAIFEMDAAARDEALRAVAATQAADVWVAEQHHWLADMDRIAQHSQAPVTWQVRVLATRVDAFTRARARVSLWRVGILSTEGFVAPVATYSIVTDEFVWQDGDWKLWSETQQPGPTPVVSPNERPASPKELHDALDGYEPYPHVGT